MRTTVDVPDPLLRQAKALARDMGGTVRELILEGLEAAIARRVAAAGPAYRLPDRSVPGRGLQDGIADLRWETIRELVHDEAARRTDPL